MSKGYNVEDHGGGNISIRCDVSNLPYTRTTELGMFCDRPEGCICEENCKKMGGSIEDQVADLAKKLGLNL